MLLRYPLRWTNIHCLLFPSKFHHKQEEGQQLPWSTWRYFRRCFGCMFKITQIRFVLKTCRRVTYYKNLQLKRLKCKHSGRISLNKLINMIPFCASLNVKVITLQMIFNLFPPKNYTTLIFSKLYLTFPLIIALNPSISPMAQSRPPSNY